MISGIVALTLSPMMSSKLLKPGIEEHGLAKRIADYFTRLRTAYGRLLDATLNVRPAVYIVWIALSLLAVPMFIMSPSELAPTEDEGAVFSIVDAPANSALELTVHFTRAADKIFQSVPETDFTFEITFPTSGFGGLITKPWDERERTPQEILSEVQRKLHAIPGIRIVLVTPPPLPGGGEFPLEFIIASTAELDQVLAFAQQIQLKAMQSGMFAFPPLIDVKIDQPQSEIVIDRDKVGDLGLNLQQVGADLSSMLSGNYVNRFNIAGRSYKVFPQIKRIDRLNPEQLQHIYVTGPNDELGPLSTGGEIRNSTLPPSLNRFQQLNAVKLRGVPLARTLLGRDAGEVRDEAHVTQEAQSWRLVDTPEGDALLLWDTPGFGDSPRLAKRLAQQGNPIGWFLTQVWDRFRDRTFWLTQKAVVNVRDEADVVLYLVNAAEEPGDAGYLAPELAVLEWIGKPVVVLLNQTGPPRPHEEEAADVARWRQALGHRGFVHAVLALDAFARCWVQAARRPSRAGRRAARTRRECRTCGRPRRRAA